jgi:hypothetical protein
MNDSAYAAFAALDPFFDVVQKGLEGLVDGQHFFDTVADEMSGPKYWPVKKRNQLGRRRKAAN